MPITQGKAGKLNTQKVISTVITFRDADITKMNNISFKKGTVFVNSDDNTLYIATGDKTFANILVDDIVTFRELSSSASSAVNAAFNSTGAYQVVGNAMVTFGTDGKIDDDSVKMISGGQIDLATYLSDYIADGKFNINKLPDEVKTKIHFFDTYANMTTNATDEQKKGLFFVLDASADESVDSGFAMYVFSSDTSSFVKVGSYEDMDFDDKLVTFENVENAGTVMYDHLVTV